MELHIKVTPNARRSGFAGWGADEKGRPLLLVKLAAPPVEGKANRELVEFLSETLGCAKGQIRLLRGEGSRLKTVEVPDSSAAALPVK
jgi:hypothetical protein